MINRNDYQRIHTPGLSQAEADRKWMLFREEQAAFHMSASAMVGFETDTPPSEGSGTIVFNGTTSYVSAPADAEGTLWSSGELAFTVEWFQYQTDEGSTPRVFSVGTDTDATVGVSIEGGFLYAWPGANFGYDLSQLDGGYLNRWLHIAVVYNDGDLSLYADGSRVATTTTSYTMNDYANPFYIGWDSDETRPTQNRFTGNITNFRWTNAEVYSGATYTVPTSPLTVLPETKLLLLGGSESNPVSDASGNVVFVNHETTWSADSPFA